MDSWMHYETFGKRLLAFYTLSFPIIQTFLFFLTPASALIGLDYKLPIVVSLLSFIPLMLVITQFVINTIALHEFIKEQKLPERKIIYVTMPVTFILYQVLLAISALRATYREMFGLNNWEKTFHAGEHRELAVSLNPEIAL